VHYREKYNQVDFMLSHECYHLLRGATGQKRDIRVDRTLEEMKMEVQSMISSAEQSEDGSLKLLIGGRIRIVVADDQPVVLAGISMLLGHQEGLEVVAKVPSTAAAQVCAELLPDVLLIDPGTVPGVIASIFNADVAPKIIVFMGSESEEQIYQTVRSGVLGYLSKTSTVEQIISCIESVSLGQKHIPEAIVEVLANRKTTPELTKREHEVLLSMAQGKSNKQIGISLGLCEGTVKVHVSHLLEKLKVGGRTEALAAAAGRGLISMQSPFTRGGLAQRTFPAPPACVQVKISNDRV
jgi:DNA-binding NarL/FixJ family response regulator